jgi:glycosyltransferase involved in cell wall biosynthesis
MRVAVWSPAPPSPSGIADYVAEQLPELRRRCHVASITESCRACPESELDLYHLGNSPAHGFVYHQALERPGVVVLHEWSLHHLVLRETVERGDVASYLREMRRAHGPTGSFVGRQMARALGGRILPALYPLNDRILEGCLAVVGLTRHVCSRAAARLPGRPVLHLPHHLCLPLDPLPSRAEARRALGLPDEALLVTAPGLATRTKRLDVALRALAGLKEAFPSLRLVVAGGVDPELPLATWIREAAVADRVILTGRLEMNDFVRHLVAADVVLSLRFPSFGEISGALVRSLGVGRPAMVTAGTPAAEEFPDGVVVPVGPGRGEETELRELLRELLGDASLRASLGRLAREHVRREHDLASTGRRLAGFLEEVAAQAHAIRARLAEDRSQEGSLLDYLIEEVRWGSREVGLHGAHLGLKPLLAELLEARR